MSDCDVRFGFVIILIIILVISGFVNGHFIGLNAERLRLHTQVLELVAEGQEMLSKRACNCEH